MRIKMGCVFGVLFVGLALRAEERVVYSFENDADIQRIAANDVKLSAAKSDGAAVLHCRSGHATPWPGITLKPDGTAAWDLAAFEQVSLDVKNTGTEDVQVNCRIDNPGADGAKNCINDHVTVKPGERKTLTVALTHPPAKQLNVNLFGMNGYPAIASAATKTGIDPSKINQLILFIAQPAKDYEFDISAIRATGSFIPAPIWMKRISSPSSTPSDSTFTPTGRGRRIRWRN